MGGRVLAVPCADARDRLTPGGVFCQWANACNIGARDLRSIAATFSGVFPDATAWLIGEHHVVFVGTTAGADAATTRGVPTRLDAIARHWTRAGVADDLRRVAAVDPFSLLSLDVAGPAELARYGAGAPVLTDDRMTIEFTAPRTSHRRSGGENGAARCSAAAIAWRQSLSGDRPASVARSGAVSTCLTASGDRTGGVARGRCR